MTVVKCFIFNRPAQTDENTILLNRTELHTKKKIVIILQNKNKNCNFKIEPRIKDKC